MAAFTLSPAISSQYCLSKNGPTKAKSVRSEMAGRVTCQAANFPADSSPVIQRRKLMNLLLFGSVGLPATAGLLVPYSDFFSQPCSASTKGGTVAKDEFGNDVIETEWLKTNGPGDRNLTQGLKGDPTYLLVENNQSFATYGINAVCTHLGCIVPWNTVQNKFMCPCHGSEYDNVGKVIKGPAPKSLELAHVAIDDGKVVFAPWTETDFRTGHDPYSYANHLYISFIIAKALMFRKEYQVCMSKPWNHNFKQN